MAAMTHPCIVCDDVGHITYGPCLVLCNCEAAQRLSDHLSSISQQPHASSPQSTTIPSSAVAIPATTPDSAPSHIVPTTTVVNHFTDGPLSGDIVSQEVAHGKG